MKTTIKKIIQGKALIIVFAALAVSAFPSVSSADTEIGFKAGWFFPVDSHSYGRTIIEESASGTEDITGFGTLRSGWAALEAFAGYRFDNGFGMDLATRLPFKSEIRSSWQDETWTYERTVWKQASLSARYDYEYYDDFYDEMKSIYLGAGYGLYKVSTKYDYTGTAFDSETSATVGGIHIFLGLELGRPLGQPVHLELLYERTNDAPETRAWIKDGGNLGGLMVTLGTAW